MGFRKVKEDTIVYKGLYLRGCYFIIEMILPKGTMVYEDYPNSLYHIEKRKCRAEKVYVNMVYKITRRPSFNLAQESYLEANGVDLKKLRDNVEPFFDEVVNYNYRKTVYQVGKMVYPHTFSKEYIQCSGGIHYFHDVADAYRWCGLSWG